uniref:Cap-18 n=1 Tax=Haemonchus contortus TaxID=6289 RepID=A0A7I4XZC4_HAECO
MLIALVFIITALLPVEHGASTTSCSNNQMKDAWRQLIVKMHNFRRSQLAKHTMMRKTKYDLPQAGNMMELAYDCQLEADAIRYANSCSISPLPKGNVVGVNITSKSEESIYHGIREAVMSWWRVVTESGPTKDVIFESKYVNTSTAFFTEMAWATNEKVGCGLAACNQTYLVVVCRYSPGGNIVGEQIYKPNKPCVDCPHKSTCSPDEGLCVGS